MSSPSQLFILAGVSGNTSFWHPVAHQPHHSAEPVFFGWPGFGETPADSISPVAVELYLAEALPNAHLQVFKEAKHDLRFTYAAQIVPLIDQHLEK